MKNFVTQHKPLTVGAMALLVVLIVASAALIKPRAVHAFMPLEMPAVQFGPFVVQPGQTANLGVINWGDSTAHVVIAIVSASSTSTIKAHMEVDLAPGAGATLPFSNKVVGTTDAPAGGISVVGVVAVKSLGADWQSSFRSLGTALEVGDGTSNTNRAFVPQVVVPAAQLPGGLTTGTP